LEYVLFLKRLATESAAEAKRENASQITAHHVEKAMISTLKQFSTVRV
jgi:hypothetical protein